jgi:hypothetical protein
MSEDYGSFCSLHGRYEDSYECLACKKGDPSNFSDQRQMFVPPPFSAVSTPEKSIRAPRQSNEIPSTHFRGPSGHHGSSRKSQAQKIKVLQDRLRLYFLQQGSTSTSVV